MSSRYLTHPQPYTDGATYGGDGGGAQENNRKMVIYYQMRYLDIR